MASQPSPHPVTPQYQMGLRSVGGRLTSHQPSHQQVAPWSPHSGDEKLGTISVWSSIGHAENTCVAAHDSDKAVRQVMNWNKTSYTPWNEQFAPETRLGPKRKLVFQTSFLRCYVTV